MVRSPSRAAPRGKRARRDAPPPPAKARPAARREEAGPREQLLARVGARVRQLREGRAQSRRALAAASGLSERFLADLEGGAGNISLARLESLCGALGTGIAGLLAEVEAAPRSRAETKPGAALHGELLALLGQLGPAQQREALGWLRAQFGGAQRRPVALLGLRGAGKSTIGRALARRLGARFIELDARVEAAAGLSLAGIFSMHGEAYYRRLAREVLAQLLGEQGGQGPGAVIATGGSIVADAAALQLLKRRCRTVWLQATPEDHWRRVLGAGGRAPLGRERQRAGRAARAPARPRAALRAAEVTIDTSRLGLAGSVEALARALG